MIRIVNQQVCKIGFVSLQSPDGSIIKLMGMKVDKGICRLTGKEIRDFVGRNIFYRYYAAVYRGNRKRELFDLSSIAKNKQYFVHFLNPIPNKRYLRLNIMCNSIKTMPHRNSPSCGSCFYLLSINSKQLGIYPRLSALGVHSM